VPFVADQTLEKQKLQAIAQQVGLFIAENFLFNEKAKVAADESFMESGILDSTGFLELVAFLEEKFGISVEDEDLIPANLDSLNAVSKFVQRKQSA